MWFSHYYRELWPVMLAYVVDLYKVKMNLHCHHPRSNTQTHTHTADRLHHYRAAQAVDKTRWNAFWMESVVAVWYTGCVSHCKQCSAPGKCDTGQCHDGYALKDEKCERTYHLVTWLTSWHDDSVERGIVQGSYMYTVFQKQDTKLAAVTLWNLNRFSIFFSVRLSDKFAAE